MTDAPDTGAAPQLDGLWLTVTELATQKGVTKQTISARVAALVAAGKIETRPGKGRTKLVNLAAFDTATGDTTDPAKALGAATRKANEQPADAPETPDTPAADSGYRDARTRGAQYDADLKEIELKTKLGELVPIADVEDAQNRAAEIIVRVIDRITTYSEAVAAAVGKDGAPGARGELKKIARDLRKSIAAALGAMSIDAEIVEAGNEQSKSSDTGDRPAVV